MLRNEIIKIFSKKSLVILIVIALFINGGYIYWGEIKTDEFSQITYKEYAKLNEDIKEKTDIEKQSYIREQIDTLKKINDFIVYLDVPELYEDYFTAEELVELERLYESGKYIKYASNISDEIALYEEVLAEVTQTINYEQVLKQVMKNSKKILRKTEEGTFEYNRAKDAIEKYSGLEDIKPYHNESRGINLFLDNITTDFLIVICIMFCVVIAITYERENNLIILSKTTVNGRVKHGAIKVAALLIVGMFIVVLMYGETFVLGDLLYGVGDLSRPIQSVLGYSLCSLNVSVGIYILLYILIKYIFYIMCVALFFFLCTIFRKAIAVYISAGMIIAGLIWGYNSISDSSYLIKLKLFNPISFGRTSEVLSRLQYIDINERACNRLWVYIICMVILSTVLFSFGVYRYAVSNEKEASRYGFIDLSKRKRCHTNVFFHELYKTYVSYRVALIHIIGLIIASAVFVPVGEFKGKTEDYRYNLYTKEIEGKYTEETRAYIDSQIDFLDKKLEEYEGDKSDREYLSLKLSRSIVDQVDKYSLYLSQKEDSYFINNDGYLLLTNGTELTRDKNIILAMVALVLVILCHTASLSADFLHKEERLIHSTLNGRRKYYLYKFIIGIISVTIIYSTIYLPQLISVLKEYGTEFIGAPAYSLEHLSDVPDYISIGAYIIIKYVLRYVVLLLSYFAVLYLIKKLRSSAMVTLVAVAIFVGPLILYFMGADLIKPCIGIWL